MFQTIENCEIIYKMVNYLLKKTNEFQSLKILDSNYKSEDINDINESTIVIFSNIRKDKIQQNITFLSEKINLVIILDDTSINDINLNTNQIILGTSYLNGIFYGKYNYILSGKLLNRDVIFPKKKCLAIIHAYNVSDIISNVLLYLINNEIDIYILDNWSSDDTYAICEKIKYSATNRILLEKYPDKPSDFYEWEKQLHKTEEISKNMNYDWYLHYDSDEIINSPFPELNLCQAISFVDKLGYNCISKTILDFRFTSDQSSCNDAITDNKYFEFGKRQGHHENSQIKIWKNTDDILLAHAGGHTAKFQNIENKCYPFLFRTDHYQYRSKKQMKNKLDNILQRMSKEEKEKGWHSHNRLYLDKCDGFDKNSLIYFNEDATREYCIQFLTRIGI
jgi:hypothetical protein